MKKIIALIGTQTRANTYRAVREFEKDLKHRDRIDFEFVFLSDYRLEFCRGCRTCFDKGEENCPIKDDKDILLKKIGDADGIVIAAPNYAFGAPARLKNLFDRLAYLDHRPRFFGKVLTVIVTQGFYGGGKILKYLAFAAENMGFRVTKGCVVNTLEPMTKRRWEKLVRQVKKASARFYKELRHPAPPPSFFKLMIFRMARTNVKTLDRTYRDYNYYEEKGWFDSDYYYQTTLGPIKKLAGALFDLLGRQLIKRQ